MILEKLRKDIAEAYPDNDVLFFDNPSFDNSIIGIDDTGDPRVVYDFDKMVSELASEDGISEDDAIEFIDYNTIRSLPYFENAPIIIRSIDNII